jgi:hypothetical protein
MSMWFSDCRTATINFASGDRSKGSAAGGSSHSRHAGSVEPEQSVLGIVLATGGGDDLDAEGEADSALATGKGDPNSPAAIRCQEKSSVNLEHVD